MGSFKGHALPGTLFLLVGLWRAWSAASRFAAAPSAFRVRAWNPVPCASSSSPLRLLELYVIAGGALADMCVEVLYSTHLRVFAAGGVNPAHLNDLEHGGMLLMFFLFGALALASQLHPRSATQLLLLLLLLLLIFFSFFYYHTTPAARISVNQPTRSTRPRSHFFLSFSTRISASISYSSQLDMTKS